MPLTAELFAVFEGIGGGSGTLVSGTAAGVVFTVVVDTGAAVVGCPLGVDEAAGWSECFGASVFAGADVVGWSGLRSAIAAQSKSSLSKGDGVGPTAMLFCVVPVTTEGFGTGEPIGASSSSWPSCFPFPASCCDNRFDVESSRCPTHIVQRSNSVSAKILFAFDVGEEEEWGLGCCPGPLLLFSSDGAAAGVAARGFVPTVALGIVRRLG